MPHSAMDLRRAATVFVATALLGWLILRRGVYFTPDSWAYWQGSVSLLEGQGYRLFSGRTIEDWPPLFSLYLAGWQAVFGVSGGTLLAATVVSSAWAAAIWVLVLDGIFRPSGGRRAVCVFLVLTYALATRHLMSESLTEVLLPGLLLAAVCGSRAGTTGSYLRWAAAAGCVGGLMVAVRYAAGPFVLAAVVLLWRSPGHARTLRGAGVALAVILASLPLVVTEVFWEHGMAHPVGWGQGRDTPAALLLQAARGCGDWFAGPPLGFLGFLLLLGVSLHPAAPGFGRAQMRRVLGFCAVTLLGLLTLFSLTYVNAELRGRFLFFVPVLTGSIALLQVAPRGRWLRLCVGLLVFTSVGYGALKYGVRGRAPEAGQPDPSVLDAHFIRTHFTIDPAYPRGAPRGLEDGRLLVAPPPLRFLSAEWRLPPR